jgi:hypothetical protein
MMMVFAAALALAGPGAEKLFGDWAVSCDNVQRCEATVLMPESWSGDKAPGLDFSRDAGPGGTVTLSVSATGELHGIADLLIDGRMVGSGVLRDGSVSLTGGTAEGLARAMASGHALTMRLGRKTVATLSLRGAAAAMRYIDDKQGRVGGVTALVARGSRSATAVPGAAALPRVPAVRPGSGTAATLTNAQTEPLRKQAGCEEYDVLDGLKPEFYRLDRHATLVSIPCVSGAYQSSFVLFVVTDGRIAPAPFDIAPDADSDPAERTPLPWLTEAEWDPKTSTLGSHAKGRGLGDCGTNQSWVWDGTRFRMTYYNGLDQCRLSGNWLTRYRAASFFK